jgi:hypothetical protein
MAAWCQLVVDWFSPLSFFKIHNEMYNIRQEGTGQWFMESDEFKAWFHGSKKTLWCLGIRKTSGSIFL